jgi:tRNA modification GTPase
MLHRSTQNSLHDTIVAQSTPKGAGAIAIVRLSGPAAFNIVAALCQHVPLPAKHTLRPRKLYDAAATVLDEAMLAVMPGPNSYTGDDVAELHLHGSEACVRAVLGACREAGARDATGGEFTLRAFVNGRLDLAQAEAVGALVTARSEAQRTNALRLLAGALSERITPLLQRLEPIMAAWRASLDFPDEGTDAVPTVDQQAALGDILKRIKELADSARTDLHRSHQVALCGAPNTGKSTLLNTWAQEERAIVDAMPGTTRDPIAVPMADAAIDWVVWDTAGMRAEAVGVEARGVALAQSRGAAADRVVWLVRPEVPVWPPADWRHVTLVASQADRTDAAGRAAFAARVASRGLSLWGWISAHTGEGIAALQEAVRTRDDDTAGADGLFVAKARHIELLATARDALGVCLDGMVAQMPLDLALGELELAARCLGAIVGHDVDAAVLDRVFKDFCIGK